MKQQSFRFEMGSPFGKAPIYEKTVFVETCFSVTPEMKRPCCPTILNAS